MSQITKINSYVQSHYPIIYLHTSEDGYADRMMDVLSDGRKIFEWNMARGLVDFHSKQPYGGGPSSDLASVLRHMLDQDMDRWTLVLRDVHLALKDSPQAISCLKALVTQIAQHGQAHITIFMVAPAVFIPPELEKIITLFEVALPSEDEITGLIQAMANDYDIKIAENTCRRLAIAFQGLTRDEIRQILQRSYQSDGDLGEQHLEMIQDGKFQIIRKSGLLELVQSNEDLTRIGGLRNLKNWLQQKENILRNWPQARAFGVEMPKGIMVAGMPGCGKSLTAKATASLFKLPLLKMDMGSLMGKYVGESENNMRQALKVADAMSPCVLWVDEAEKAFATVSSGGAGSDVAIRMFGHFLIWMQEKTSLVFVIATANDISMLPPELLRKGRFDEIFYVDFPAEAERKEIFKLHLDKRGKMHAQIDLPKLAKETDQYSGADIEAIVKESIEIAFIKNEVPITTERLLKTIESTQPLGEVMKDKVEELKKKFEKMKIKRAS